MFDYTVPYGYEITNIWKRTDSEEKSVLNGREKSVTLTEDGDYAVIMENKTINNVNLGKIGKVKTKLLKSTYLVISIVSPKLTIEGLNLLFLP